MKQTLVKLETPKDKVIQNARSLLVETMEEGFECVMIIGMKDGKAHFKASSSLNFMEKIGMIEAAKFDWLQSWE